LPKGGGAEKRLRRTVIDEERLIAKSTRPGPSHAIRKLGKSVLLRFGQDDISQNLVVTSLSQWMCESDFYANECC